MNLKKLQNLQTLISFSPSGQTKTAYNRRFGNMAGRRIYSQLFARYSA